MSEFVWENEVNGEEAVERESVSVYGNIEDIKNEKEGK
jgi:hypothetical protein